MLYVKRGITNNWRIQMGESYLDNLKARFGYGVTSSPENPELITKNTSPITSFQQDTIASATVAKDEVQKNSSVRETLSSAVSWLWGLIYGQTPSSEQPNGRPVLEAPTIQDEKARQSCVKEISNMQKRILSLDDEYKELLNTNNPQNQEALLMKLLTMAIKNQLKLKEESGLLSTKKVESHKKDGQNLNKDHKAIREELETINYKKDRASTIDTAVGVTAGALFLATIGATALVPFVAPIVGASAMPVINVVLAAASGKVGIALGVAKSGSVLLKGYTTGVSDEKKKESYLVQAQQELAKEGVKVGFDEMKKALQDVSAMWSLLRETADRQLQASSAMLK